MAKVRVGVRQAGLSLIELTVVAAVIAILAALTTVAVTGVATSTRGTTRTSDMEEVQKAMETFVGAQAASHYPTSSACKGGESPNSITSICEADATQPQVDEAAFGVDVNLDGDATDATEYATAIDWAAAVGDGRTFSPDFVKKPKHADELDGTQEVWVVNANGKVVVLIPAGEY